MAELAALGLTGNRRALFDLAQDFTRAREKAFACLGEDDFGVAFSLQEFGAEPAFKFLDLVRERRRRDAETQGGAGEMLLLGDGDEIAEQAGFDVAHFFSFIVCTVDAALNKKRP